MTEACPTYCSKDQIYGLGTKVAQYLGYMPNGDIEQSVRNAGGRIRFRDLGDGEGVRINSVHDFVIAISPFTSIERDKFTIAHELGHYVLHHFIRFRHAAPNTKMIFACAGKGRIEYEANWFAASFLMPRAKFKDILEQELYDIDLVAERFGVSSAIARRRAKIIDKM